MRFCLLILLFTMAYGERFRCEFANDAMPSELGWGRTNYTVRFLFTDFTGEVTDLRPMAEPVRLRTEGSNEDIYERIFPYKATFSLVAESFWDAQSLLPSDDKEIQVIIEAEKSGTSRVIWFGWVQPTDIQELYQSKPYPVEINAVCGLMLLKSRMLADGNEKRLTGKPTILSVAQAALGLTSSNLPIITGINLFELADMAAGQTVDGKAVMSRDPLARTKLNADSLVTSSHEAYLAYDALESILSPFGLRMAQVNGYWMIIRTSEIAGGLNVWDGDPTSVMTRRYNPAYTSLAEPIDFTVNVGRTKSVQAAKGMRVYGLPILQTVSIRQNFGDYATRLINGDFSQADVSGRPTGWNYDSLDPSDNPTQMGTGTEEDPYRLRIYGSGTNNLNLELRGAGQEITLPANSQTKRLKLRLRGRFRLRNVRSAQLLVFANPSDLSNGGQYMLKTGGSWMQNPPAKDRRKITITNVYQVPGKQMYKPGWQHEKAGWCDINQEMDPVSNIRSVLIFLCVGEALDGQTTNPEPYIEYADIRLEVVQDGQVIDGLTVTKKRSPDRKKEDPVLTLSYGDVPDVASPSDRLGTFFKLQDGDVPTTRWYPPDADAVNHPESGLSLIDWRLSEYTNQRMKSAGVVQGSLYGELPWGIMSVLRFDDILDGNGNSIPFQLTKHDWQLRSGKHTVVGVQVIKTGVDKPTLKQWETPDGPIVFDEDESGNALPPRFNRLFNSTLSQIRPLIPSLAFTLKGAVLPAGLEALEPNYRYQLFAEVRKNDVLLGLVQAIARKTKPPFHL